ncbi:MAG TPA: 50S ribosomal protein L4 [Phycisphaerales bacterium]|nr:50S ribosomal protein L4 [Phycisphaerales bacterium]
MEVPVLNIKGQKVGSISVDEQGLGGEVNPALIKQAFVRYHANQRQGSSRTKKRSEVEGSTRKLYRQKGTGNARVGPARTPTRRGGGHAHSKKREREHFRLDMPIKMRRKANRNALLAKLLDGEVRVIDSLEFARPQTRAFRELLEACQINRSCVVALAPENANARLSARNLDDVTVCSSRQLTCWEMLNHRFMIISKADLQAWIDGPSRLTDKSAKSGKKADGTEVA